MSIFDSYDLALATAGYREKYAMTHGNGEYKTVGDRELWVFTYSDDNPYQDANGATFDITNGAWIN